MRVWGHIDQRLYFPGGSAPLWTFPRFGANLLCDLTLPFLLLTLRCSVGKPEEVWSQLLKLVFGIVGVVVLLMQRGD